MDGIAPFVEGVAHLLVICIAAAPAVAMLGSSTHFAGPSVLMGMPGYTSHVSSDAVFDVHRLWRGLDGDRQC